MHQNLVIETICENKKGFRTGFKVKSWFHMVSSYQKWSFPAGLNFHMGIIGRNFANQTFLFIYPPWVF